MNIGIQLCYYIILIIVLYYFSGLLVSRLKYFTLFDWWNKYKSAETIGTFEPTSIGLYNQNMYSFNIYQSIIKSELKLDETSILFLQQKVLNNLFAFDNYGFPQPDRYIKPKHLTRTIAWNNEDTEIWPKCGIIDYYGNQNWYSLVVGQNPPLSPDDSLWSKASLYIHGSNTYNVFKPASGGQGFWPYQNGCIGFFDSPPLANDATPTTDPNEINMLKDFNTIDNFPEVGKNNYIPGFPGGRGSWAQLFADWGIVYTNYGPNGFSNVPVISKAKSCYDLTPCPDYCKISDKEDTCSSTKTFPNSDISLWNKSAYNSEGRPGINFFALNKINPNSLLITSWVSGLYNDSKIRKMVFNSSSVPNLLGAGITKGYGNIVGGWIRFIKCLNIKKLPVDKLINQICREYSTSLNPYYIPPDDKNCKVYSGLNVAAKYTTAIINGAGMGPEAAPFMIPWSLYQTYNELKDENTCK
jgi:hypothetical protein